MPESIKLNNPETTRRKFFKYTVNGIIAAIGAILSVPLGGFYILPALKKPKVVWKKVGPVENFPEGEIRLIPLKPLERRQWPEDWGQEAAWLYNKGDGKFVLYNIHCTHVGCPVNWNPQAKLFFSPCHGGVFDKDGKVLAGPPPRPLDRYELKIESGV
ncbi:MAG: ubiquinol-cytochrome c reductase iron-sulfur subunit, partial [Fidelibacterota bacterium]